LALIEANKKPYYIATLRYEQNLKPGDEVTVIGYPAENGHVNGVRMRTAKIIDTKGPSGQAGWLQFTEALQHGNSGGPLLDQYGNVIGVVRGHASFREITYQQLSDGTKREIKRGEEQNSDIAVNLPVLTEFLRNNFVNYGDMLNFEPLNTDQKFEKGQRYIVNVQCIQ
jgi:S1-C subfamily serine protease